MDMNYYLKTKEYMPKKTVLNNSYESLIEFKVLEFEF